MDKRMYIQVGLLVAVFAMRTLCLGQTKSNPRRPRVHLINYVDPQIGSGSHGHVFVGASVPFGAVQLGPTNLSKGWDWSSGYHISDSTIGGFQHTHLSGTGIGDLGDISLMPTTGELNVTNSKSKAILSGYGSLFDHSSEVVKPGYYQVKLKRYHVGVQLTATSRVGFHCYTFPPSNQSHIIIDLQEGIADSATDTYIKQVNSTTIQGYRFSKGWARDQQVYFTAIFSKPMNEFAVFSGLSLQKGNSFSGQRAKGVLTFETKADERVMVKVGISPVSCENAMRNIKAELPGWNFEPTVKKAAALWEKQLRKIVVECDSLSQFRKFYTALYHTMIAPSAFNDVNGDYRGTDNKVYPGAKFQNTTTYSLWDTYRALHPLYTIIQPERVNAMINTMLAIYQQQASLPMWHLMGNETHTMVGYSAVPVIADAYLKGFNGYDVRLAYQAMKATAMRDNFGRLSLYKKLGYIPADSVRESVAMGLEYAIDDWCLAQVAEKIGLQKDYSYFHNRGLNYRNYYDPSTRFMRGRLSATEWRTPFSPFESKHMKDDYTEGNAWQYTWLVPQDIPGLIQLLGGKAAFNKKLDSLFTAVGDHGKEASADISGLIGQYAHGNEPSHHISYLYALAGEPGKTAEKVRFILNNFYTDKPDGIIGNEDVGQMSAWYILSSLGFYQVNPAGGAYVFGSPTIRSAIIRLPANKTFTIKTHHNSIRNIYIKSLTLNGKKYRKSYISYQDIMAGGEMVVEMTGKRSEITGL